MTSRCGADSLATRTRQLKFDFMQLRFLLQWGGIGACAFCDKNTKFGPEVAEHITNRFGYWVIAQRPCNGRGGHFPRWTASEFTVSLKWQIMSIVVARNFFFTMCITHSISLCQSTIDNAKYHYLWVWGKKIKRPIPILSHSD